MDSPLVFKISVLIVTWNSAETIERCLESLPPEVEAIVIDNASSDATASLVAHYPEVRLVRNEVNLGFGAACNLAASFAEGELLLLLNPDAVLEPGSIEVLSERLSASPTCGAVGPRILGEDGSLELSWGERIGFLAEWRRRREQRGRFPRPPFPTSEVAWLSGACLLIRKQAWNDVGGFDEKFFLYFEDLDLCVRLRKKGWHILFEPSATLSHVRGHSSRSNPKVKIFYRLSQLRFYRKHASFPEQALIRVYLFLSALARGEASVALAVFRGSERS